MNNEKFLNNYNLINSSFVTLRNILIAIAFLIKPKTETYPIIPSKWSYRENQKEKTQTHC